MKLRSSKNYYNHFAKIKSGQGNLMTFAQIRKSKWKAIIFQFLFRTLLSSIHMLGSVRTVSVFMEQGGVGSWGWKWGGALNNIVQRQKNNFGVCDCNSSYRHRSSVLQLDTVQELQTKLHLPCPRNESLSFTHLRGKWMLKIKKVFNFYFLIGGYV